MPIRYNQVVRASCSLMTFTNPEQIFAVNPLCPHAGCTVTWKGEQNYFSCPCHDSTFAPDGKVLSGIAKEPLPQYEAKIEGDLILVKNI